MIRRYEFLAAAQLALSLTAFSVRAKNVVNILSFQQQCCVA